LRVLVWVAVVVLGARPGWAGVDVWRWIPSGTRVVVQFDPRVRDQARARDALGVDALVARFVTPQRLPKLHAVTVAYVPVGEDAQPVAYTQGGATLTSDFARLHGPHLETASGRSMFGVRSASGAASQLEPECIAEGTRPALAAVLDIAASVTRTLAGVESESARRLLQQQASQAAFPVSLVYVAPPGGADLYAVIADLDRIFGAEMSAALEPYQKPIQMLGVAHAVRVDLRQDGRDLDTTLWLAMPNRMAAQIASVSLDASRDMVRVAARTAVKGGSMSADDAKLLEEALLTLQTQADGELVRVSVRVPESPAP